MKNTRKRIYEREYHKIQENAREGLKVIIAFISLICIFLSLGIDQFQGLFFICCFCAGSVSFLVIYWLMTKIILPDGYRVLATNRMIYKTEGQYELSGQRVEKVTLPAKMALRLEKIGRSFDRSEMR